jgi:hypothetical protein
MLTEAEADRRAFEEQAPRRQYVRNYAKAKARREVIRTHLAEFLGGAAQQRFERLLEICERDADAIAREAAEEACSKASRTEPSAYEVTYIEAYADALPALVATAWTRSGVPDQAA